MAFSQDVLDFSNRKIEQPLLGQADYGTQLKEIPGIIMPAALASLYAEFGDNRYTAYPLGFYKNVKLNDKKQRQIADILTALTGIPADELGESSGEKPGLSVKAADNFRMENDGSFTIAPADSGATGSETIPQIALKDGISYDEFKLYMHRADELIGGGSNYAGTSLAAFGRVPITYEEAVDNYNRMKDYDRFTGAYARLFSDYIVIPLSLLPVFVAVAVSLRDRRAGVSELIYTRNASSALIVLTRYFAVVAAVMLPVLLLSHVSNMSIWKLYDGSALDYAAPFRYSLIWILPSVMISTAVGMFLTELTRTPIAIAVQGLWWFIDINRGMSEIDGGYSPYLLSPRHNALGNTQTYIDHFGKLVANRLLFAAAALVLVAATVVIYEQKRRGNLGGYAGKKLLANLVDRKSKSAA